LISAVRDWRKIAGAAPGPHEAWLVHRGLETLEVRYSRMRFNALVLAELFAQHPKVVAVRYPGLASHPSYQLAQAQMAGGGSLIALTLADTAVAERFIQGCALMRESTASAAFTRAPSAARAGATLCPMASFGSRWGASRVKCWSTRSSAR
jgi:cystathionine gamma-lyase